MASRFDLQAEIEAFLGGFVIYPSEHARIGGSCQVAQGCMAQKGYEQAAAKAAELAAVAAEKKRREEAEQQATLAASKKKQAHVQN